MIELPPRCSLSALPSFIGAKAVIWATPSVQTRLMEMLPWGFVEQPVFPGDGAWLVVAGGGTMIDRAKLFRQDHPTLKIAALPTIWGSGAEASPIAVISASERKQIYVDPRLRPDLVVEAPELGATVRGDTMLAACGDTWAHALEGFLSPLASAVLRADLAAVLHDLLTLPLSYHRGWFHASSLAAAGQGQSSVGLVHGFAHTLEPLLHNSRWGHARLCTTFLLPVFSFNRRSSTKSDDLLREHLLSANDIGAQVGQLFDRQAYSSLLPLISAHWSAIIRDRCSRTNSSLVRPADLDFFLQFSS